MEVLSSRILVRSGDPERSRAFYRDTLGLAVYREFPGGTVFFLGQGFLEVSGRSDRDDPGPGAGIAVWIQVRHVADTVAELERRGVTVVREPRREPWGLIEAWIADPDGLRIVLVEIPPGHPIRTDTRQAD